MKYTFCTLFDHNYLYKGLALHSSLIRHCPDFTLWILAMTNEAHRVLKKMNLKNVRLIKLSDFEDKQLLSVKPDRTAVEYMWTLTPSLPLYVFKRDPKAKMVAYIDADCFFYSDPKPIYDEMGKKSILLIEHRYSKDRKDWEKTSGRFNVEMLIFRRDRYGLQALKWWRDRCIEWCYFRHEDGKLGDQMYLNDWPTRFKSVHILKHKGGGLAPWNIKNYRLSTKEGRIFVDNEKLIFYHFHAFRMFRKNRYDLAAGYQFNSTQKLLVYRPYIDAIERAISLAKLSDKGFRYGFSDEPKFDIMSKFITLGVYAKSRLVKKLISK